MEMTPWGTPIGEDSASTSSDQFTLDDIINNGELIMVTLSGPQTYYDYHNHGMGLQYLLCQKFSQRLGVSLRVEVCKDTAEMIRKVERGEADIIAFQLPKSNRNLRYCGAGVDSLHTQWAVSKDNPALADELNRWFKPSLYAETSKEEDFLLSTRSVVRHVYSPMLNRGRGIISRYDAFFQQYSVLARVDWRLMAAQCYQESTFDPNAHSWAGAQGLMQIMPSTAASLGLPSDAVHDPEMNIAAAARLLAFLQGKFSDVPEGERILFVLGSYNGGASHIRDAMALTRKHGGNPYRWNEVSPYVLLLSDPAFYRDPVVRNGYMRGSETVDYVRRIRQRYAQYCGFAAPGQFSGGAIPHRSHKHHRFR